MKKGGDITPLTSKLLAHNPLTSPSLAPALPSFFLCLSLLSSIPVFPSCLASCFSILSLSSSSPLSLRLTHFFSFFSLSLLSLPSPSLLSLSSLPHFFLSSLPLSLTPTSFAEGLFKRCILEYSKKEQAKK